MRNEALFDLFEYRSLYAWNWASRNLKKEKIKRDGTNMWTTVLNNKIFTLTMQDKKLNLLIQLPRFLAEDGRSEFKPQARQLRILLGLCCEFNLKLKSYSSPQACVNKWHVITFVFTFRSRSFNIHYPGVGFVKKKWEELPQLKIGYIFKISIRV